MYHIRIAAAADVKGIYQCICLLEATDFNYTLFETIYNRNIADASIIYLVAASAEDAIIGFISCHTQYLLHHCAKVAEIQELYVHEQYRGQGIGRHLVNEIQIRLQQCATVEVTAQNKRTATHVFYEQLGFKPTHKKFVKPLTS
jgi:PhnO protein